MNFTKEKVLELLKPIKVAKILSVKKHDNADKLWVTEVSTSVDSEPITVVTAATNMKEGDLVPYLKVGETVPGYLFKEGKSFELDVRNMRGIDSHGMILAEDEIGLSDDHEGIFIVNDYKLGINDEQLGKSITGILSKDDLNKIFARAGIIEISADVQKKIDLITKDLAEVVGKEDLAGILSERELKIYWGTAPTSKPHLGYFVPLMKVADFLEAGCEVTILLADIHAYLDNMKSTWELLEYRTQYYEFITKEILKLVGVPVDRLKFVRGRDFQLKQEYTLNIYKVAALASLRDVKKAGAEVVKQVESPLMSSMLYPILQALDEEYLGVDAQFGGVDQRKIFMFAREYLPKIGYKKRIHLMNTLIPGLGKSGKMSSSEPNSKIDFEDTEQTIIEKINKAFSIDKQIEGNGLLTLLKYVLFKIIIKENRTLAIQREDKWGGNIEYSTYEDLEKDFANGKLSSVDLKPAIANEIIKLFKPLKAQIDKNMNLINKAYPKL